MFEGHHNRDAVDRSAPFIERLHELTPSEERLAAARSGDDNTTAAAESFAMPMKAALSLIKLCRKAAMGQASPSRSSASGLVLTPAAFNAKK